MGEPGDPRAEDVTLLFEEYVAGSLNGAVPEREGLLRRAGTHKDELEKRIEIFRSLRDLSDALDETPLECIGRFTISKLIGQGGSSRIFAARDPQLARDVALKVLSPEQIAIGEARAWLLREGRTLARLVHPNVVQVFEADEADGFAYIAMERLAGPSLAAVLARMRARAAPAAELEPDPQLDAICDALAPIGARTALVLALARALAYCHAAGVVHRDVKPGNVILLDARTPKWIDFGIAHLDNADGMSSQLTQGLVGTPAYIAPEQVDDGRTGSSPHSDQFSLGVVLYELLTLVNPFARRTRDETMTAISRAEPPPPRTLERGIAPDLERICLHALERAPADRYPSMDALAEDLAAFLDHRAISVEPPSVLRRAQLWVRRHRRDTKLVASAAALLVVLYGAYAAWSATSTVYAWHRQFEPLRAQIATFTSPHEFPGAFRRLDELRTEARKLEHGLLTRFAGADTSADTTAAIHTCSEALSKLHRARIDEVEKGGQIEHAARTREVAVQFADAFRVDAAVCPECEFNRVDRERGWVDIAAPGAGESIVAWRRVPMPELPISALDIVDRRSRLDTGTYRVRRLAAGGRVLAEVEFEVRIEEQRQLIDPVPLLDAVRERMVRVPARTQQYKPEGSTNKVYALPVAEFWLMPRLITRGELIEWGPKMHPPLTDEEKRIYARIKKPEDSALPVTGDWPALQGFAARLGGRLPAIEELMTTDDDPKLFVDPEPAGISSEHASSDLISGERSTWIDKSIHTLREEAMQGRTKRGFGFRIAISADPH